MKSISPDPLPDALWSRLEVLTQASQSKGQLTVWDMIPCEGCGAESGESCFVGCLGPVQ